MTINYYIRLPKYINNNFKIKIMEYDQILINAHLLSLNAKITTLITALPPDQKIAYDAEIDRQRAIVINNFINTYNLSSEEVSSLRQLFSSIT